MTAALYDYFIDAIAGSDANNGAAPATAWATIEYGYTNSASGKKLALKKGQRHLRGAATSRANRSFIAYDAGASNPIFDARQNLSGKTWTLDSGNVWKTTVTLPAAIVAGGTTANSTYFGVWLDEAFLVWHVGGADIAANIAAVEADPGSFAINRSGSTAQDPRGDTAATGYDLYVQMPDSSDPNGATLLITSYSAVATLQGGHHVGITFKGAWGKDSLGLVAYSGTVPKFEHCSFEDFGCHGYVGPCNLIDHYSSGAARPGYTGYSRNRSAGAAINRFTDTALATTVLTADGLNLSNANQGLYAHSSGTTTGIYKRWDISGAPFVIDNVTAGIQVDTPSATRLPMIIDGIQCTAPLAWTNVDQGFVVDSAWSFTGGGSITFSANPVSNATTLVNFVGTAPSLTLKDMTIENLLVPIPFSTVYNLGFRTADASHSAPTLTLDNVQDISPADRMFYLPRTAGQIYHKINIVLINGSVAKLMDQAAGTNYPESLTVGAGCTFSMGDRSGPEIESALTGAGITHSISHNTTIVNRAGAVLSSPGW
ncbi:MULTISPECIES: hypothetical protein [unclassified Sphingomonas]|uniref:hypothetical protein n=1 Tax=unclassified Sphingomonas TaxID=196159 RepID=UPI000701B954|nr:MULTISPECIES: hypothetical protein [unclassified Sphingomonas]KQX18156.1 hypothetical protein ASD17_21015 [Sphingomonas sp. Root1294]KQY72711.1 hypothetical protein ASD39_18130 [Sphingomonas sp. Root50]